MELDLYLLDLEERSEKVIDTFEKKLSKISTGRANPQLVSYIKVDYYGTLTPIEQLSSISVPQAQQILIKPFDLGSVKDIYSTIVAHNLSVQVVNEGHQIRLTFPPLTTDRRKELVKGLSKSIEEAKVGIRLIRQEVNKEIKKDDDLTEDQEKKYLDEVQKIVDKKIEIINKIANEKEKDLMTV
ncbi:ribosome recycling factor [Mesomycoplasma lagogenitalium]|uniref:Ribosome-recycling factor n=1 Tax=Mesomycoplasma lagogenitalium TaxID=171286 RepID=A0ABY8LV37_9BACT|nr:ribosome recycling factor [Mesomycoplasma lagogenitalium]WGI36388.1 ribosome recycling factor [Mesomycoplasma lagogenitalium]